MCFESCFSFPARALLLFLCPPWLSARPLLGSSIPVQVSAIQALLCSSHWVSFYLPYLPETGVSLFTQLSLKHSQDGRTLLSFSIQPL